MTLDPRCTYDHDRCWSPDLVVIPNSTAFYAHWICRTCKAEGNKRIHEDTHKNEISGNPNEYYDLTKKEVCPVDHLTLYYVLETIRDNWGLGLLNGQHPPCRKCGEELKDE